MKDTQIRAVSGVVVLVECKLESLVTVALSYVLLRKKNHNLLDAIVLLISGMSRLAACTCCCEGDPELCRRLFRLL